MLGQKHNRFELTHKKYFSDLTRNKTTKKISAIQSTTKEMSGRLNKDGYFQSMSNGNRRVIDGNGNINGRTLTITGSDGIQTNCIAEKTTGNGIRVKSDVNLDSGVSLRTGALDAINSTINVKGSLELDNDLTLRTNCLEQTDSLNNGIRVKSNVNMDSGVTLYTSTVDNSSGSQIRVQKSLDLLDSGLSVNFYNKFDDAAINVNGSKVLGRRLSAIGNPVDSSGAALQTSINSILSVLRRHGLIENPL